MAPRTNPGRAANNRRKTTSSCFGGLWCIKAKVLWSLPHLSPPWVLLPCLMFCDPTAGTVPSHPFPETLQGLHNHLTPISASWLGVWKKAAQLGTFWMFEHLLISQECCFQKRMLSYSHLLLITELLAEFLESQAVVGDTGNWVTSKLFLPITVSLLSLLPMPIPTTLPCRGLKSVRMKAVYKLVLDSKLPEKPEM